MNFYFLPSGRFLEINQEFMNVYIQILYIIYVINIILEVGFRTFPDFSFQGYIDVQNARRCLFRVYQDPQPVQMVHEYDHD